MPRWSRWGTLDAIVADDYDLILFDKYIYMYKIEVMYP